MNSKKTTLLRGVKMAAKKSGLKAFSPFASFVFGAPFQFKPDRQIKLSPYRLAVQCSWLPRGHGLHNTNDFLAAAAADFAQQEDI